MTEQNAATGSLLDERLEIETPERVTIVYDLAGIGSRFAAGTIDVFILAFLFMVLGMAYVVLERVALPRGDEAVQAFVMAAVGGFTLVLLAYYVGFEWLWSGQTPGKRSLKLRVISQDGGPASVGAIFLRNILRVADLLPGVAPYGLGGVVMFVNARSRRIGDIAAGTIVVRERAEPIAAPRAAARGAADQPAPGDGLDAADLVRVRTFLARAHQMMPSSRAALAHRMAAGLAERHGVAFGDAEQFLRLLAQGRTPRELRDLSGPPA